MKERINAFTDFASELMEINRISYNLLTETYGEKEIKLPISIHDVAKKIGLNIYSKNLNLANSNEYNQRIAELNGLNICVEESAESDLKRFAIAHEIAYFLIDKISVDGYYSFPFFSSDIKDIFSDIFATFLLLPFDIYLYEFKNFVENIRIYYASTNYWLKQLSFKAEIPYSDLINSYAYYRLLATEHYRWKIDSKPLKVQIEEYGELFY